MRRTLGLLGVSLSIFGSAVGFGGQGQEAPKAETVFKNIKTFKGDKASDIIPAMQFMSASLKVECDYCHTADRASDEKEEKNTAREMVEMQRGINKQYFNGRNVITCATCHAGKTHPTPVPPVEGLSVRPRRAPGLSVPQILESYGKAAGGDSAHPITGMRITGTSINEKGEKAPLELVRSGEKFVATVRNPKADQREGYNGAVAWFAMPQGIFQVPVQYAAQRVSARNIFTGVDSLPKLTNATAGTAKLNGKDAVVVTGFTEDKTRVSLYFDKQTNLLARTSFSYPTILGSMVQINDYANYKKVQGVLLPTTVMNHSSEGDVTQQFRRIQVDGNIAPATFDPPKK